LIASENWPVPRVMQEALDGKQIDRLEHVTQELYRAESG
jgi:hypothetical protein